MKDAAMAQEKDDAKGGNAKDQADKPTFNPPQGPPKKSQHDDSDRDEQHRMGAFTGAGEHSRDSDKGRRGK
jgi:hypothetical protein